ncbi:TPA: hypothetical protein ACGCDJ_003710, partial [Vibrio cholerae]|nr:Uncharacterised protein [Vibrio cholerae]
MNTPQSPLNAGFVLFITTTICGCCALGNADCWSIYAHGYEFTCLLPDIPSLSLLFFLLLLRLNEVMIKHA